MPLAPAGDGPDAATGAGAVATGVGLSVLSRCFFFDCGTGSLFANSCAPGMGGGRNEEDGDGNGDDDGGESRESDSCGGMSDNERELGELRG